MRWWTLLIVAGLALGEESPPDHHNLERAVVSELFTRDVQAWAEKLAAQPLPADVAGKIKWLHVFARAGHAASAQRVLDALSDSTPEFQTENLSPVADFFIGNEAWDLARYAFERLPHVRAGWRYVFVGHWERTGDLAGLDRWLADRQKENRDWFFERLKVRERHGTAGELLAPLAARIRAHPDDIDELVFYVDALKMTKDPESLAWLPAIVKPKGAYTCFKVANNLLSGWPAVARVYLERSLELPVTEEERPGLAASCVLPILVRDSPTPQTLLRGWTKHRLMEVCQKLGDHKRAQALLEELGADYPDGIPPYTEFAGRVQQSSGARVIEKRIRKAEAERKNEPKYWRERALYFHGRKEQAEAAKAWHKALELARREGGHVIVRMLDNYVWWLRHTDRENDAAAFLVAEFATVAPDGAAAARIVKLLLGRKEPPVLAACWRYLDARAEWGFFEEDVLEHLAVCVRDWNAMRATPTESARRSRAAFWTRAEALARDAHPSRAYTLGWVMTRKGAAARSIPLLEEAIKRLPDGDARGRARFVLFEAHLEMNAWQPALAVWPQARDQLGPREWPVWLGYIAKAAARSGASKQALALWRDRTNLDRLDFRGLDDLAEAGLRKELIAFYVSMALADLRSVAPRLALARLRK